MARGKRKNSIAELSNEEVAPRKKSRPRKKQGVTKTKSAAVKALIRKNAATSPLLQLPSEVRENILMHLLGDNLIHVKYLSISELYSADTDKKEYLDVVAGEDGSYCIVDSDFDETDYGDDDGIGACDVGLAEVLADPVHFSQPAFRHAICVATQSEQSAYQTAVSGNAVVPEGESPDFYIPSCNERHANCKMCGSGPKFLLDEDRKDLAVDLNVLGVCRQLYEEANHLLWATNTFSFDDPRTLKKFLGSLNPAQKHNLASIHISATIGGPVSYPFFNSSQRSRWDLGYWGTALKITSLNVLRGVQTLYLCINQVFECVSRDFGSLSAADLALSEETIESAQKEDMEPILRLRLLSLKHVTVVVYDEAEKLKKSGKSGYRWTAMKKNEYAESIRAQLVDPKGADLVNTEVEAANFLRRIEVRDRAADRVTDFKETLNSKRAEAVRAAHWAKLAEDEAELATQKADQVSNKSSKKGKTLHDTAEKLKSRAITARNRADITVEKEEYWQGLVATAKRKYKRAMASLGETLEEIEDEEEVERLLDGPSDSYMDLQEEDMALVDEWFQSEDDHELLTSRGDEASDEEKEEEEEEEEED